MNIRNILSTVALVTACTATAVNAQTHNGYVDSMSATPGGISTVGWVCRIWYPQYTYTDQIEIYEDGVAGTGTLVYTGMALNQNRPDTSTYCGGQTSNGTNFTFFWSNPAKYRNYYVYVRDNQSGQLQLLNPSPITPLY